MTVSLENVSPPKIRHNLPVQLTSFVGRETEIAQLQTLLTPTQNSGYSNRLVTIVGWGGAGKTRLSLEAAGRVLNDFADGVWLIDLAPLTKSQLVDRAVASVLDIHEEVGTTTVEALTTFLTNKRLLLILDNCEHLLERCATLAQALLAACPNLYILATSREALNIAVETIWPMPPLSMPTLADLQASDNIVENLLSYEAVRLFVERARKVQPTFQVTEQNAPALLDVCQRLDGLPLAIELAAARVKLLSVEQLALRLKDVFRVLIKGNPQQLPRQQTLRALIDWSYQLLSEPEKQLLQRLAIFAGGWTLEAAQQVCRGETLVVAQIENLLQQLVNKSLVVRGENADHEPYYRLLETIRQYAQEKLEASEYYETVSRKHGEYFLQFAEQAEPLLRGEDQKLWLQRIDQNHDNLRAALQWFLQRQNVATHDLERGVRLAGALWWFWWRRGHLVEGRRWLEMALSKTWVDKISLPKPVLSKATHALGGIAYHAGDYDLAKQMWEESLKLKKELGDLQGASYALNNLGEMTQRQGNYRQSVALHEESLGLKRETGDRWGMAYSLNELGTILQRQGEYQRAKAMLEESIVLFDETGHQHGVARSYHNLGKVLLSLGDFQAAAELHRRSQAEFEQLGERSGVADAFDSLGLLKLFDGEPTEAQTLIQQSLTIFQEVSDRWGVSYALNDLGLTAFAQQDYAAATQFFQQSLTLKQKLKDKESIAWTLEGFALTAALMGQAARAGYLFGAVETLRTRLGTPVSPANQNFYQHLLPPEYLTIPPTAFLTARQTGSKVSTEQAILYALSNQLQPNGV